MIDFCRQLYHDIESNLKEWIYWNDGNLQAELNERGENGTPAFIMAIHNRRRIIQERLDTLKKLIDSEAYNFDENHYFF